MNFYEKEDFKKTVYFVTEENAIDTTTFGELCEWSAKETTAPTGVSKVYHLRGLELWTWGFQGQYPEKIETFETQEEADHALLLCHRQDLYDDDNAPIWYYSNEECQAVLDELNGA